MGKFKKLRVFGQNHEKFENLRRTENCSCNDQLVAFQKPKPNQSHGNKRGGNIGAASSVAMDRNGETRFGKAPCLFSSIQPLAPEKLTQNQQSQPNKNFEKKQTIKSNLAMR